MVYIKLKLKLGKSYKIGSSYYTEIETYLYPVSTLETMLKNLPDTEMDAKRLLKDAIRKGHYKKTKGNLYFVPPIEIDNEIITHCRKSNVSIRTIRSYLTYYREINVNNDSTRKLEALLQSLELKHQIAEERRLERELYIPDKNLPLKKRKT